MNADRQREHRQTLLIILAALIVAIACWVPIGVRIFSTPSAPGGTESSGAATKD